MKKTVTLHLYALTSEWDSPGETYCAQVDYRQVDSCMVNKVWLGQVDVEIDFPEIDTRQAQIDQLAKEIENERAESTSRVNILLERISKLQAIGVDV
jgi:hypothetical protein